jgi:UDP-sulfoquinovose synthase
MRVLILGGDGYLGWPQSLYLSNRDYEVFIVDNFMRRHADLEHGFDSLVPIFPLKTRTEAWHALTGRIVRFEAIDVLDYVALAEVFREFQPEAVVHFAEQRSAPYSMIDRRHALYTQYNNIIGTLNVLYAIKEFAPECHLVKLGTMGEYGTPNIDIEEGFIDVSHNGRTDRLPFPKQPGSFYHLTKVHDSHNIMFCCRVWGLRATDLNQGVVYGAGIRETQLDPRLATRFDYDQIYGTVLNRFCVQAAVGSPITVYGRGGQTRGYINIRDTVRCIDIALTNPPDAGGYRVFNQITEQFNIRDLAEKVSSCAQRLGMGTSVEHIPNPRLEAEEHYYNATYTTLRRLGLQPHPLTDDVVTNIITLAVEGRSRIDRSVISPSVDWRQTQNTV